MSKAKKRPVMDSDSDESDSDSEESSQAKKSRLSNAMDDATRNSSSSGSSSDEDDEWTFEGGKRQKGSKKQSRKRGSVSLSRKNAPGKKQSKLSSDSSDSDEDSGVTGGNRTASVSTDSSTSDSSDSDDDDDESDSSESSAESEKFSDGLDNDLIGDEEDRQKLASMTDVERELELYKRHEQRLALMERQKIQKMLKREQKLKKKKKDHDSKSRTLRTKEPKQTKATRAIDELRATRTADKQKKAERKNVEHTDGSPLKKQPLQVSAVYASDDDDDDERGNSTLSDLVGISNNYVSTIEELTKIKLSRFRLEKWVHMPFFEKIVQGCFVRIGIGQHEGRMVYRICEIIQVQETPKVYSLGTARTNKGLKLRFGTQEKFFRMEYVSNSPFTENEFSKWKAETESQGAYFPTLRFIEKKVKELDETKNVNLKEEDIDKIINEKQKFRKNPHNYALTKNRMLRDKEIAEQLGNEKKAADLSEQLSQLEERAEELDRRRNKGLSAITYINERNRQRNVERAEEALKEEMASIKDKEEDPFTRRKCMPRLVTFGKEGSEAVELVANEQTKKLSATPDTKNSQDSNNQSVDLKQTPISSSSANTISDTPFSSSTETPRSRVDDLFSAHDFDISIDLPTPTQGTDLVRATPKQVTTPKNDGPRRSLNLSDYKKRRGLI